MAAMLKKRAIAEFTQVIQEEAKPPPPKRLKLVHRSKTLEAQLDLQNATDSYDALQSLVRFGEYLPTSAENAETIVQSLVSHFFKEKDAPVRAKLAALIGDLACTPGLDVTLIVNDVLNMLKAEKSHKVISQLMRTLTILGRTQPQAAKLHHQLTEVAKQHVIDTDHTVRCKCLELIGALGSPDQKPVEGAEEAWNGAATVVERYMKDDDPRVRTSAFEAMLSWHERSIKLEQGVYKKVVGALTDDYEGVRVAALKLIWVLSHLYPDSMVPVPDSDESLRLVDDGFVQICNMVNDLSMKVRTEAAVLLGSLHQVSQRFLEQTLDKKLMSQLRRKRSAHERQKEHFQTGEWSTGKKWADDAPKEEVDADNITLINSGACGAFVHGLEDEYMEVRNASIDSLCELATHSAGFANLSQDFLVDMFNDEIESVRLNAINSIRKIAHHILLREDQVEIVMSVLKDFNYDIRDALREMFCCCKLGTKAALHSCIMGLLDNLKRYPQDRAAIWKAMQHIGRSHPSLTLPLVPELLSAHPYFDTPEPEMDDPAYISILILVFNATVNCPTMTPLFPDHTLRHYTYLRDTLPDLVPILKLPGIPLCEEVSSQQQQVIVTSFLDQTVHRLSGVHDLDSQGTQQLMNMAIKDLGRVSEVDSNLSATAECMALYLQCQLHLSNLMSGSQWTSPAITAAQETARCMALIDQVIELSQQMEQLFVGLSLSDLAAIRQVRLRALTLQLLSKLQGNTAENKSACVQFLQVINQLQRHFSTHNLKPDAFTTALLSEMHKLESCDPNIFLVVLQSVLTNHKSSVLQLTNHVRRGSAEIVEPTGTSDNIIKFTAGLTTGISFIAKIENVENLQNIRIQVRYPDQQTQFVVPKSGDFRQLSSLKHRLVTEVLLSHSVWSEVCPVELSLVLCYNCERDIHGDKAASACRIQATNTNTLQLCKPVKVLIAPKAVKR